MSGSFSKSKDRFKLDPKLEQPELKKVGNIKTRLTRKLVQYEIPLEPQHLNVTNKHRLT
jgi:hypothetical protein